MHLRPWATVLAALHAYAAMAWPSCTIHISGMPIHDYSQNPGMHVVPLL